MEIFLLCLPLAVGGLAAALTMGSMAQYSALPQPPLAPPPWVFPVAWTVLYLLMGLASRRIYRLHTAESRRALRLHYAQLGANFVWPLLFSAQGSTPWRFGGCCSCWRSPRRRWPRFAVWTAPPGVCSRPTSRGSPSRHTSITPSCG